MMGEGLRCRHIRSKPAELGQKVGNKSDKARGGGMVEPLVHGGPQRHYRHHRHQQERLLLWNVQQSKLVGAQL